MRCKPSDYLKITETTIYNSNVLENIKINALGDLHLSQNVSTKVTDNLKYQLDKENAHYICLLGDLIDLPSDLSNEKIVNQLLNFIRSIATIAPVIVVLGSHDFIDIDFQNHYNDAFWKEVGTLDNVYLLNDSILKRKEILFMGYFQKYSYWYPYGKYVGKSGREDLEVQYQDLLQLKELYTALPHDLPKIGLMHSANFYNDEKTVSLLKEYDMILCGHYHNGCIPVILDDFYKGNKGLISPEKEFFPNLARGSIDLKTGTKLLISGGITKIQYSAPKFLWPLNACCYQEMDTIVLTGDEEFLEEEVTRKRVYVGKNLK